MNLKVPCIIISLMFVTMFSCKNEKAKVNLIDNIDLSEWDDITLDYTLKFCDFAKYEYKKSAPPVVNRNYDTLTVKSHFKKILKIRKVLFDAIKSHEVFSINKNVTIIESYKKSNTDWFWTSKDAYYQVFSDNKEYYSFFLKQGKKVFKIEKKEWRNPDEFVLIDNSHCITDLTLGHPLDLIDIKSRLYVDKEGKVEYKIEYIYFGEQLN